MATYHDGELSVQHRAGLQRPAESALRAIRTAFPEVAMAFLTRQPMIVVGAADPAGRLWTTLLTGDPGFLQPTETTLAIRSLPHPDDPLAEALASPAKVGMIAIEPATRRRMRINGTSEPVPGGLLVTTDQVISNCPKYIQQRTPAPFPSAPRTLHRGTSLTPAQQRTLAEADTFFVATASPEGDADASHRGGSPGFVRVLSPTRLRWPDYQGNTMFLTLGNLELNPAAALLVPSWTTGSLLHLTGTAETVWDEAEAAAFPGAQRLVDFTVEEVREATAAMPLRWSPPAYSKFNPPAP
ncbi:pyridoxamine 5'-phosphate oxidase family protein [Actinocorallia populi]|uniref:pyridoxamine 5'-phosphate oxidase family protein n=1 Tax=Actinocorallia populi TaxID=2079200 RepID=UPI000D091BD7|nr:pyridoxamine 5'-phosphate oxidase family protein [Actinocorallia populi]